MNSCICAICGSEKLTYGNWFLLVESPCEERLRITHWDHRLAAAASISHACGAAHAREILAQWITLGKLPFPYKSMAQMNAHSPIEMRKLNSHLWEIAGQSEPIGEIAVNRRGMPEKSAMLNAILEAIYCLVQNASHYPSQFIEMTSAFPTPIPQDSLVSISTPAPM